MSATPSRRYASPYDLSDEERARLDASSLQKEARGYYLDRATGERLSEDEVVALLAMIDPATRRAEAPMRETFGLPE